VWACVSCFDPRPRVRGDSAHTSPRAAASWFRSTPPREGRPHVFVGQNFELQFRSTPPREGRPRGSPRRATECRCFDPRPRVRGDSPAAAGLGRRNLFRSTPPREGRRDRTTRTQSVRSFDPRPRVRGDLSAASSPRSARRFDPRPRVRGDLSAASSPRSARRFDPRPRVRGDRRSPVTSSRR